MVEEHHAALATVRQNLCAVSLFLETVLGRKEEFFEHARPRHRKNLPVVLSFEETRRTLAAMRIPRLRTAASFTYSCGLRAGETVAATLSWINADAESLHVHDGKGGVDRIVPLPEAMVHLLREHWRRERPRGDRLFESAHRRTRAGELLPVGYFHLTFPLPAELREAARSHYRVVCGSMLQAAAEAAQVLAQDRLGGRLGILGVLHTWGRTLCWHPHVHCLIPGAVVDGHGRYRLITGKALLPLQPLSAIYRAIFLRRVRSHPEAPRLPQLDFSKPWVVNRRACREGPGPVLRYLARYTKRGPLPETNIREIGSERMVFRYRSHRTGLPAQCTLTPPEFLRRTLQHAPPPGFHRIRYYGILAPGARRTLRALRLALLATPALLAPLLQELRERLASRAPCPCPHRGSRQFVRSDYTWPNRRAPPCSHPV